MKLRISIYFCILKLWFWRLLDRWLENIILWFFAEKLVLTEKNVFTILTRKHDFMVYWKQDFVILEENIHVVVLPKSIVLWFCAKIQFCGCL